MTSSQINRDATKEPASHRLKPGVASRLAARSILLISAIVLSGFVCICLAIIALLGLRQLGDANEQEFAVWERVIDNCKFLGSQPASDPLPPHLVLNVVDSLKSDLASAESMDVTALRLIRGVDVRIAFWLAASRTEVRAIRSAAVADDVKAHVRNLISAPLAILPAVVSGLDVITSIKIQSGKALAPLVARREALQHLLSRGASIIWFVASAMTALVLVSIAGTWLLLLKPPIGQLDDMIDRLGQNERKLKTTLDSIGEGVITTDADFNVVSMNPVAEVLTGWSQSAALGMGLDQVVKLDVQLTDAAPPKPMHATELAASDFAPIGSYWLNSRNGRRYRIAESVAPLKSGDKDLQGIVVVFRDISKQFDQQRKLDSRAKLQALGELSSGVAHDFNNFLAVILGTSSLALRQTESPQIRQHLESILKVARTGSSLTEKLLSFARSSPSVPTRQSIFSLLQNVATKAKELEGPKFQLTFFCSHDLVAEVDRERLEAALLHVIASALEAISDEGQIRLHANEESPGDKRYLVISVEDNGKVADFQQSRPLLDEFFAMRSVSRFKGLGIPMASAFAEQAGGELRIATNVEENLTSVSIRVPMYASRSTDAAVELKASA